MLPSNKSECEVCGYKFIAPVDIEKIPFFNRARKYDWKSINCPKCGTSHRLARFTKRNNSVIMLKEY